MQRVLREREVAAILGITRGTMRRYRARGIGPAYVRVGLYMVGYLEGDVARWLESRRNRPRGARPA
jgi:predicted DNA-binding transcriptional regulator AlpA